MRYIIRHYLSTMKEDRELDSFCRELLISKGLVPRSNIQRGRQYGVDIAAVGKDNDGVQKVFLLVIKQGDLTRKVWDGGTVNDVRPSLDEIKDAYIRNYIPEDLRELPIKIIVCFNGDFDNAVSQNWTGYVNNNQAANQTYSYWTIDNLVEETLKSQIHDDILPHELALDFRRVLALIDLPDMPLDRLSDFITNLLHEKGEKKIPLPEIRKRLSLINLLVGIIHGWCRGSNNIKPSIIAGERIILLTFQWLYSNEVSIKKVEESILILLGNYRINCIEYINKIGFYIQQKDSLSNRIGSHEEYCLVTFEQIGIYALIGQLELWYLKKMSNSSNDNSQDELNAIRNNSENICNFLYQIIVNNPSANNPKYDEHLIEVNLAFTLFISLKHSDYAIKWLNEIIDKITMNVYLANFLPIRDASPADLFEKQASHAKLSYLLYFLAEWCVILKQPELYKNIRELCSKKLPNVSLQLWFPDEDVEQELFIKNASVYSGRTMVEIKLPENHLTLEKIMKEEKDLINREEHFKYNKDGYSFLSLLSSRHHRMYPFPNSWRECLRSPFRLNL